MCAVINSTASTASDSVTLVTTTLSGCWGQPCRSNWAATTQCDWAS